MRGPIAAAGLQHQYVPTGNRASGMGTGRDVAYRAVPMTYALAVVPSGCPDDYEKERNDEGSKIDYRGVGDRRPS